ncbi:LLM class flavin-dependent oxidoreductase [Streptomyces hiroshimensis]|uniref:Luciferase n=1 Tax=Streptomyces hiroshimensis TaxID=66424 RepID=A0ABQ2Y858_9ACTN|nr:LLM class flavin-dependent oxidoreductase [Streptomyces hiroshimensis]GGX74238.1 luciferase [Streptomyces hiroshimensis]
MLHGLSLLPDCRPERRGAAEYFHDVLNLARIADSAGLSHVKITEHYLTPYGGYCPSPPAFLSAVAACTTRIRLLTGCLLPVFHHPVRLAAETAMVDAISGGRLDVGFARAYLPQEFEAFGIDMDESRERYEKTIEAVVRLWTEEDVTEETPFFSYRRATSLPRPVQRPHPPVWGAAVRSRQSFAWLGEQGYKLLVTPALTPLADMRDNIDLYREAYRARHGTDGPGPFVAASLPLLVADDDRTARATADPLLAAYLDVWAEATSTWQKTASRDYPGYTGMSRAIRAMTPQRFRETGSAVVGGPASVTEQIAAVTEALAPDCLLWQADYGAAPGDVAERSLRLFVDKVLPALP